MSSRSALPALCIALLSALWSAPTTAAPRVVASIMPVHSLVAAVMAGIGEPALLVDASRSPHDYAMRPSDARLLQDSELVFRVGETLEAFLDQPLASLASRARVVDLMHARGIHTLRFRSTAPAAPAPLDDAHVEDGSAHDHAGVDPHIWLDPDNAAAMVRAIRDTLQAMDPDNAAGYIANAEQTLARLTVLDRQWQEQLAPFRSRPFIVFHEAYRYLESHFGLASAGSVTPSPQQPPGARRVAELRRQLRDFGVGCVFREPQFRAAIIETLVDGTAARVGVLDAIGLDISPGADAWFEMMGNNVAELVACLREDP